MHKLEVSDLAKVRAALAQALKKSQEARFFHRLHCVLLVGEGMSCYQIAAWFGKDPRTIERWVRRFNASGAEGLREASRSGRLCTLILAQLDMLYQDLQQPPSFFGYPELVWTGRRLSAHLQAEYGVNLSVRQCRRLLYQARSLRHEF